MTEDLFTIDGSRLRRAVDADSAGYLGSLVSAAQACRAFFLAAEVGAVRWDSSSWPDLVFGIWSDDPVEQPLSGRRRHNPLDPEPAELSTWLHLHPTWPQLGGVSIPWPLPDDPIDPYGRLNALVGAAVGALNATFRQTVEMAYALADRWAAPPVELFTEVPELPARTFTAAGIASSEADIGYVLSALARDAETDAVAAHHGNGHQGVVAHFGHAVTALPGTRQQSGRFLVTVTATIEARSR